MVCGCKAACSSWVLYRTVGEFCDVFIFFLQTHTYHVAPIKPITNRIIKTIAMITHSLLLFVLLLLLLLLESFPKVTKSFDLMGNTVHYSLFKPCWAACISSKRDKMHGETLAKATVWHLQKKHTCSLRYKTWIYDYLKDTFPRFFRLFSIMV